MGDSVIKVLNHIDKHKRAVAKHHGDVDKLKPKLERLAKRLKIQEKKTRKKKSKR